MRTGTSYPVLRNGKFVHTDLSEMTKDELKEIFDGMGYGQIKQVASQLVKTISDFKGCE